MPGNIKLNKKQMSLLAAVFSKPNISGQVSACHFYLFNSKLGQMSHEYHSWAEKKKISERQQFLKI
jgi:hypothetical protein